MKLEITGKGTLAAATRAGCAKFHEVNTPEKPDFVWICHDVPVTDDGRADYKQTMELIMQDIMAFPPDMVFIVSSQLVIGSTALLEKNCDAKGRILYSPENIRVATAEQDFLNQSRIVVGRRTSQYDSMLLLLLTPFTPQVLFTDPETAEMCKHALNTYLGMNIAFINEIARISKHWDVDIAKVTLSLKTDRRVSAFAPLHAGHPFGGGHLARDINNLMVLGLIQGDSIPLIRSIMASNSPETYGKNMGLPRNDAS